MIVADSSALVAVVLGEPDAEVFRDVLGTGVIALSAASLTETRMVVESRAGMDATRDLDLLVADAEIDVVAYDSAHAAVAHAAWRRFGKGRHPASLNLGDCMAYATARLAGAPLLFKGDDFAQTDIVSAL